MQSVVSMQFCMLSTCLYPVITLPRVCNITLYTHQTRGQLVASWIRVRKIQTALSYIGVSKVRALPLGIAAERTYFWDYLFLLFFLPGHILFILDGVVIGFWNFAWATNSQKYEDKLFGDPHFPLHYAIFGGTKVGFSRVVLGFWNFAWTPD